jgi:phosphatidylserine decarboxylase
MLPIAPEGRLYLALLAVLVAVAHLFLGVWALPTWLLLLGGFFIFRNWGRETPSRPLAVVSPLDARVMAVDECHDPFLERPALCVTLRQSWRGEFNMYSPVECRVQQFFRRKTDTAVDASGYLAVWLKTDEADDVVVAMQCRSWPHVFHCMAGAGDRLGQSRRCGFLGFARWAQVYLPPTARPEVRPGQRISAATDVIATLVHKKQDADA